MNLRILTISAFSGSVLLASMAYPPPIPAADQRGFVANPLRSPDRNPPPATEPHSSPAPADSFAAASHFLDWRAEPGALQIAEAAESPRGAAPPYVSAAAESSRTLIQRLRDRRLAYLEKQSVRLRELSERDAQRSVPRRPVADLNGPENPDLQIDFGVPVGAAYPAEAYLPMAGPLTAPHDIRSDWASPHRVQPTEIRPRD